MIPRTPNRRLNTTGSISRNDTSRNSLNTSSVSVTLYPKCNKKKQHAKEMMNLICLTSTCKNQGPICTMCKSSDHSGHNVMPIKAFLSKLLQKLKNVPDKNDKDDKDDKNDKKNEEVLEEKKEVMVESQPILIPPQITEQEIEIKSQKQQINQKQEVMKILQEQKIQMFAYLSHFVNKMALQIQKIEQKIHTDFQSLQNQLMGLFQTQNNAEKIVEDLIENSASGAEEYCDKIISLMDILTVKSKDEYFIKSDFCEQKITNWKKKGQNFMGNIEAWADTNISQLKSLFEEGAVKKNSIGLVTSQSGIFKFSSQLKMKQLTLVAGQKSLKQTQKIAGIGFIEGFSIIKDKSIKLKIKNLSTNIAIGIGLKDIVKTKTYKGIFTSIGHGVFMASNNSFLFSHNDKVVNATTKGINFITGSEIVLTVKGDKLEIKKQGQEKSVQISLKKLAEPEWKQAAFCVMLGGVGDCVEIIDF